MGDLDVLTVTLALAGLVVLYGAIKNKNPIDVIKLTLQGKPIDGAAPLAGPAGSSLGAGAVPNSAIPGTPQADGDARTDPPGYNSNDPNTGILPIAPGDPRGTGMPPVSYTTGGTGGGFV